MLIIELWLSSVTECSQDDVGEANVTPHALKFGPLTADARKTNRLAT